MWLQMNIFTVLDYIATHPAHYDYGHSLQWKKTQHTEYGVILQSVNLILKISYSQVYNPRYPKPAIYNPVPQNENFYMLQAIKLNHLLSFQQFNKQLFPNYNDL